MGFAGGALLALIFVGFLRISVSLRPLKERASLIGSWSDEALPIFFDKIFHPIVAVVLSVTYVFAFGEIIPQAICTRYGLAVGANFVWLVRILMVVCYPISYPIGWVLEFCRLLLTEDSTT